MWFYKQAALQPMLATDDDEQLRQVSNASLRSKKPLTEAEMADVRVLPLLVNSAAPKPIATLISRCPAEWPDI
jgi:hypothetical protein